MKHELIKDDNLTQLYFSYVEATNDLLAPHWHNHLEIIFIKEGTMTAYINEDSFELTAFDISIVNPKDIHYTHVHGKCRYYLLQIPSVHLARICSNWQLLHFGEYLPHSLNAASLNKKLSDILAEFIRLNATKEKGHHLLFLIQLYRFLYLLYTEGSTLLSAESKKRTERDFVRIEESMLYVKKNYKKQISLAEIAGLLSVTPEYFCRLFKKYTGQTFVTYVNQVRLLHFYQDLIQTEDSITFLLDKHGITNYKAFMRTFKEAYGTTPHRLRKLHLNDK